MKIKNNKTNEELTFSDDWKIVSFNEKKKPLINGKEFIGLFKHWAEVNGHDCLFDRSRKIFVYKDNKDMLFYKGCSDRASYGIGFYNYLALEDLKDGESYSYNELVGE